MVKILSAILLLGSCFSLVGCRQKEDCIPKTLGQAEGLYLYYNNITNGKDEILQYHFDESNGDGINPVLFEDIYIK